MVIKITDRFVKKIAATVAEVRFFSLAINQMRIKIKPIRLPLDTGLIEKNGLIQIGSHGFISGRVRRIVSIQSIIIRPPLPR
jgi:hypothetical protein